MAVRVWTFVFDTYIYAYNSQIVRYTGLNLRPARHHYNADDLQVTWNAYYKALTLPDNAHTLARRVLQSLPAVCEQEMENPL